MMLDRVGHAIQQYRQHIAPPHLSIEWKLHVVSLIKLYS